MPADVTGQYDSIYRYCYFKLKSRETAEDITQETFLRYFEHYNCETAEQALRCLYTIARNLCVDEYRRGDVLLLPQQAWKENLVSEMSGQMARGVQDLQEEQILTGIAVRKALAALEAEEAEFLLLRHVNELPVSVLAGMFGISRFSVRRKLLAAAKKFKGGLRKEGIYETEMEK